MSAAACKLSVALEKWPLIHPFHITGYTWHAIETVVVSVMRGELTGRGEAAGVYYLGETPATIVRQIEQTRPLIESGASRQDLLDFLPPGGARNAMDCALWDLEARERECSVADLAGVHFKSVIGTFTCGANAPQKMADDAREYAGAKSIKVKLTGETLDVDRLKAVRSARPDARICVDANQGFTPASLEALMPQMLAANVEMIEQPFPVGSDALLANFSGSIPFCADESVQSKAELKRCAAYYDMINIKLDKCGGLTEALSMIDHARDLGLKTMVGNMIGTSLAIAPAMVVAQHCSISDLDGPLFLDQDRSPSIRYNDGRVICPPNLWGGLSSL